VRWVEHMAKDTNEHYYHDMVTGKSQWDLPEEGWCQLVADDGAHYYWEPVADATQWSPP